MPVKPGARLGPYEVLAPLGAGGMGEVYRARDPRLAREVAIKILPEDSTTDLERLRRFEQEAKAVGALNHPNLLAVFDTGQHEGAPFVVFELLEGETLRERLAGKALALPKALDYAIQIARGLSAAHEKGIVHRDLKPENLFLTRDGRIKVLDFGLAKLRPPFDSGEVGTETPTASVLTDAGRLLGTVGYMSPEQVRRSPADHRSDLFSFGSVLYEMLAGKRAFRGETQAEAMAAILNVDPPPVAEANGKVPVPIERIVRHCLEKRPEDRFQSARDLVFDLESVAAGANAFSQSPTQAATIVRSRWREYGIVATVLGLTAAALALHRGKQASHESGLIRLNIAVPERVTLGTYLSLSPDGRRLAFMGTDAADKTMIWVRSMDAEAASPVPGTEGGGFPFWSPDSREIAFYADKKLKRVALAGGSPQTIYEPVVDGRGGTWNAAGQVLFTPGCCSGLFVVPASGGASSAVTTLDASRSETSHRWPLFLPDGRRFLYMVYEPNEASETAGLYLGALDSTERTHLVTTLSLAGFEAPDRLFYVKEGRLMMRRLDLDRREFTAEATPVADQVRLDSDTAGLVSFATSGGLVAYRGGGRPQTRLSWFDRNGRSLGFLGQPSPYTFVSLSPDDRYVAVSMYNPGAWTSSVWVLETAHGQASRLTFENVDTFGTFWSSDPGRVLFTGARVGEGYSLFETPIGGGAEKLLWKGSPSFAPDDWSTDGRYVVYEETSPETGLDLWVLPLFGERKPHVFLATPTNKVHAKISPDGKWITYASDALGRTEVFAQPFPSGPGRWQVSSAGGDEPVWRRDSKEIFYAAADGKLMAAAVRSAGGRFEAGVAQGLFVPRLERTRISGNLGHYAVSADGQRILVNALVDETPPPITVLLNWTPELRK